MKEEDQVIKMSDVMEPAASPGLGPQVVNVMKKVREAMYSLHSIDNIYFPELADEHEPMNEKSLLKSVYLLLSGPPYNVQSGGEDVDSHSDILTLEGMADALVLRKRVMRTGAHGYLFCFALHLAQWYKILARARK